MGKEGSIGYRKHLPAEIRNNYKESANFVCGGIISTTFPGFIKRVLAATWMRFEKMLIFFVNCQHPFVLFQNRHPKRL